ncbi:hypothetical protein A6A10_02260 [Otariodibacter oris]|uniref:Uncharacterized protein n=1 Tax=Otariodibacter oris TaxID=1032623 RepID=A0A420XFT6_9PAST|nr:hypothetical protein A6A10_02260 [Otariodibacter oris]RKR71668.1 hypothetical protein DES31_1403 [Otariodibacter oris]
MIKYYTIITILFLSYTININIFEFFLIGILFLTLFLHNFELIKETLLSFKKYIEAEENKYYFYIISIILSQLIYYLNIYNINHLNSYKDFISILFLSIPTLTVYYYIILNFYNKKFFNYFIKGNYILDIIVLATGYYFLKLLSEDIVFIFGYGYQQFNEFYLIIFSLIFGFCFIILLINAFTPIIISYPFFLQKTSNHPSWFIYILSAIILIFIVCNIINSLYFIDKINNNDTYNMIIKNSISDIFYTDSPKRCTEYYNTEDKIYFISSNEISVAHYENGIYQFKIDKCDKSYN